MQATAMFWDIRAQKYDDDIKRHDFLYARTIESTKSLLSNSDVVLDFACGSGEIGLDIARHAKQLHGIDASAKMIELANQKIRDRRVRNADFSHTDVFDPGLSESSFSAITAFNIFHLLDDIPVVLARLHNLLAPGGLMVSQTPCLGERNLLVRALIGLAERLGFAPPIRSLTSVELESLVSSCGFEILENEVWDEKDAVQRVVARKGGGAGAGSTTAVRRSRL